MPFIAVVPAVVVVILAALLAADGDPAAGRDPSDVPRTRLAPGHVPAQGPALGRIRIPSIGVDAEVVSLDLNRDRTLQVPAHARHAGWWSGGAAPGRSGTAVIAGHVDSRDGPAVFFRLRELRPGDRITVSWRGRPEARFEVQRSEQLPKNHFPTRRVYASTGVAALRLITCSGPFDEAKGHYRDNLVVYARHVSGARRG